MTPASPPPAANSPAAGVLPFFLSGPFTQPWQAGLFLLLVAGVAVTVAANGTLGDLAAGILGVVVLLLLLALLGFKIA